MYLPIEPDLENVDNSSSSLVHYTSLLFNLNVPLVVFTVLPWDICSFFVFSFILGSCSCSCYPRSRSRGEAGGGIGCILIKDNVCFLLFLSLLLTTRYVTKSIYLCYVFELEHCRKSFGWSLTSVGHPPVQTPIS